MSFITSNGKIINDRIMNYLHSFLSDNNNQNFINEKMMGKKINELTDKELYTIFEEATMIDNPFFENDSFY